MENRHSASPLEVCRMSWFLVKVQGPPTTDDVSHKSDKYFIIHSVDINDFDSSNMYVDSFVKFNQNQNVLEGKVLLASEERAIVAQEMQQLTCAKEIHQPNETFFLLQYSNGFNNVIYTVLPESLVRPKSTREVIVYDEQEQKRTATVLLADKEQKSLETKFQALKAYTLLKSLENTTAVGVGQWIWVQYSLSPHSVVYTILNQSDNIWYEQNLYKDVVAYFKQGQNVYQAIVLQRSDDIKVLLKKMSIMKESCLQFFKTRENKENVTNTAAMNLAADSAFSGTAFMANRITFYGSHLNTNSLG